jgi:hypothetical protein
MMKRVLVIAIIAAAAVLGMPVAHADDGWGHGGCDCGGYYGGGPGYYGGGYNGGYYGGYNGWYPGKWLSGCVGGPWVHVCW